MAKNIIGTSEAKTTPQDIEDNKRELLVPEESFVVQKVRGS